MSIEVDLTKFKTGPFVGNSFKAVTPSDTEPVFVKGHYPRKIHVGGEGTLALFNEDGESVPFGTVPSGWSNLLCFTGVADTGTTATQIVAIG